MTLLPPLAVVWFPGSPEVSHVRSIRVQTLRPGRAAFRMTSMPTHRVEIDQNRLSFQHVGKKSPAHRLAIETLRGERPPDRLVSLEELLAEL